MSNVRLTVDVNGENRTEEIEPRTLLVHFLRDHLGLTGTHIGCDTSNCGACTVLLDGKYFATSAEPSSSAVVVIGPNLSMPPS